MSSTSQWSCPEKRNVTLVAATSLITASFGDSVFAVEERLTTTAPWPRARRQAGSARAPAVCEDRRGPRRFRGDPRRREAGTEIVAQGASSCAMVRRSGSTTRSRSSRSSCPAWKTAEGPCGSLISSSAGNPRGCREPDHHHRRPASRAPRSTAPVPQVTGSQHRGHHGLRGASADLVRGFVTTPLEEAIAAARRIDYIESQSVQGLSTISCGASNSTRWRQGPGDVSTRVNQVRADLLPNPNTGHQPAALRRPDRRNVPELASAILQDNQVTDI